MIASRDGSGGAGVLDDAHVLVEQNLAAALTLAQRAHIINNGHIAYEGSTREIKARPHVLQRYLGV